MNIHRVIAMALPCVAGAAYRNDIRQVTPPSSPTVLPRLAPTTRGTLEWGLRWIQIVRYPLGLIIVLARACSLSLLSCLFLSSSKSSLPSSVWSGVALPDRAALQKLHSLSRAPCLSVCLYVCLSRARARSLSFSLSLCLSIFFFSLSLSLSIHVYLNTHIHIYIYIYIYIYTYQSHHCLPPSDQVSHFLTSRHYGSFKIFNLCEAFEEFSNGNYDGRFFHQQVSGESNMTRLLD